jgi:hypothetical protein
MKMDYKRFIGLLGIFLAFGLVFVACNDGSGNGDGDPDPDPDVSQTIEAAFTNMLKANFISGTGATVSAIKKMNNWGQTNSEYGVKGDDFVYKLPSSFGTVKVLSGGTTVTISGGAVLMSSPYASISWGTATGDATYISPRSDGFIQIVSGGSRIVTYPYTVSDPSGSGKTIKGKLNVNRTK